MLEQRPLLRQLATALAGGIGEAWARHGVAVAGGDLAAFDRQLNGILARAKAAPLAYIAERQRAPGRSSESRDADAEEESTNA